LKNQFFSKIDLTIIYPPSDHTTFILKHFFLKCFLFETFKYLNLMLQPV